MNINQLRSSSFWLPVLLVFSHLIAERFFQLKLVWVDAYVDPFCFAPIILHLISIERQFLFDQKISILDVAIIWLVLIVVSEIIFPLISHRFTSDIYDAIALALGSLWFALSQWDNIKPKDE